MEGIECGTCAACELQGSPLDQQGDEKMMRGWTRICSSGIESVNDETVLAPFFSRPPPAALRPQITHAHEHEHRLLLIRRSFAPGPSDSGSTIISILHTAHKVRMGTTRRSSCSRRRRSRKRGGRGAKGRNGSSEQRIDHHREEMGLRSVPSILSCCHAYAHHDGC